jgi:hypothetical protein
MNNLCAVALMYLTALLLTIYFIVNTVAISGSLVTKKFSTGTSGISITYFTQFFKLMYQCIMRSFLYPTKINKK